MTERSGHVLCCPDKFRGSIDAETAAAALADGVREAGLDGVELPLADGGEGTLKTVLAATGGVAVRTRAPNALGRERPVRIGTLPDGTALVEMAEAAGLASLAPAERDVMAASSAGVGVMIRRALELAPERVIVSLGGSATVDGGLGALRELGARLLDSAGRELQGCGADLLRLDRIETSRLDAGPPGALEIVVDAWCPVHGAGGAAEVFGPQKGASPEQVRALDGGLRRLADLLGMREGDRERLGTGGAFAGPLAALTGAAVSSGADYVRHATDFEGALAGAALCITGEGRVDGQSGLGKTARGVVEAAELRSIPAIVVGGAIDESATCLYDRGAAAVLPIGLRPRSWAAAKGNAADDLRWMGRGLAELLRAISGGVRPGRLLPSTRRPHRRRLTAAGT